MAQPKSAAKPVQKKEAAFNPASLSIEEQEAVVEHYLGLHPKYYVYEGGFIINVTHNMPWIAQQGVDFNGFKPALKEQGVL